MVDILGNRFATPGLMSLFRLLVKPFCIRLHQCGPISRDQNRFSPEKMESYLAILREDDIDGEKEENPEIK